MPVYRLPSCEFPVRVFHLGLIQGDILHGRIQLFVAEDRGDFLNRHPVSDQHSGKRPAELMRMNMINTSSQCPPFQHCPYTVLSQTSEAVIGKQRRTDILSGIKVAFEVHSRNPIEVHNTLFISFPQDSDFLIDEIDIIPVELCHLADAAACSKQKSDNGDIAVRKLGLSARFFQVFQFNVRIRLADLLLYFDGADIGDRVLFPYQAK